MVWSPWVLRAAHFQITGSHAGKSSVDLPEFLPGLAESLPHSLSVVGACAKDEKLFAIDTALFIVWANFEFASNHSLFKKKRKDKSPSVLCKALSTTRLLACFTKYPGSHFSFNINLQQTGVVNKTFSLTEQATPNFIYNFYKPGGVTRYASGCALFEIKYAWRRTAIVISW